MIKLCIVILYINIHETSETEVELFIEYKADVISQAKSSP